MREQSTRAETETVEETAERGEQTEEEFGGGGRANPISRIFGSPREVPPRQQSAGGGEEDEERVDDSSVAE